MADGRSPPACSRENCCIRLLWGTFQRSTSAHGLLPMVSLNHGTPSGPQPASPTPPKTAFPLPRKEALFRHTEFAAQHGAYAEENEASQHPPIRDFQVPNRRPASAGQRAILLAMTNQELEERCAKVIADATVRMQNSPNGKMREKWRSVRETWMELLQKAQGATPGQ